MLFDGGDKYEAHVGIDVDARHQLRRFSSARRLFAEASSHRIMNIRRRALTNVISANGASHRIFHHIYRASHICQEAPARKQNKVERFRNKIDNEKH